jgi:RNA polymerase sigma-70 factor (ECF subfamily)
MESGEAYQELRPLLFSIAYRMVGSVSEAEDIVQETFLRFHRAVREGAQVESPKAYLSAVTTSMAFLVLLESLSPVERAVFLLREVFGYGYDEIAGVVDKTEDNCRQLAARARRHVEARRPRFEASRQQRDELARRFFAAVKDGDTEGLVGVLAADAVMYGDGGGKAPALATPIHGRQRVARLLLGLGRQARQTGTHIRVAAINGQPGALALDPDGRLIGAVCLDIADGQVQTVRSIVNPDKLRHLGPVAGG